MRLLLVSDAWHPQVNGVVRTLDTVCREARSLGHEVEVISPDRFRTIPCPTYPEIRLALRPKRTIHEIFDAFRPNAVHIATEGPLGFAARAVCRSRRFPFTTSYHTRFPEYVAARAPVPLALGYAYMRWFHSASGGIMVATESIRRELIAHGFNAGQLRRWTRGVDTGLFSPDGPRALDLPRPVFLYVGRVAVEKNIEAFLGLDLPGTKLVVGDGPALDKLKAAYPDTVFAGHKEGEELAAHYRAGDVFVFPSRTDTFGLVLLEALASGLPVAALPVPGPLDVIGDAPVGMLNEDLAAAALAARDIDPALCRRHAELKSWRACAELFLGYLAVQPDPVAVTAPSSKAATAPARERTPESPA